MTAAPVRVGVLGTGRIGRMHAELVADRVPGAELAMVYDVDTAAAAGLARRLGVPAASAAAELVASAAVDAVAVCTSTDTHVDLRALAAIDRASILFMVGFNRRFDPAHRSVRDAVASGVVGDVHVVRITSRDPEPPPAEYVHASGGIFRDMTIHDFDMARYVTGSEVVDVTAHGAVRIDPVFAEAGDVDTAVVVMTHENGALTVIDNSRRAAYGFDQRVEAFGSSGVASSENAPAHSGVARTASGGVVPPLPHFFLERYLPSYIEEWTAFVAAVRSETASPVPAGDGRAALVAALAADRSLRARQTVALADLA